MSSWAFFTSSEFSKINLQTLVKNLYAPASPFSFHSNSFSGGAANMINNLVVSAPYLSNISSGSTPLFLDFDIFSTLTCNSSPDSE